MMAIRNKALTAGLSRDLTKLYEMIITTAPTKGPDSSETMTVFKLARGTSTASFSEGTPSPERTMVSCLRDDG